MARKNVLLTCTLIFAEQETGSRQEVGLGYEISGHPTVTFSIGVHSTQVLQFSETGPLLVDEVWNMLHSQP